MNHNEATDEAVKQYKDYICNQVLALTLELADEVADSQALQIDDINLTISVRKA